MLDRGALRVYIYTMKHGGRTIKQAAKVFSSHPEYRRRMRALEQREKSEATKTGKLAVALRASLELEAAFATPVDLAPVPEEDSYKEVA